MQDFSASLLLRVAKDFALADSLSLPDADGLSPRQYSLSLCGMEVIDLEFQSQGVSAQSQSTRESAAISRVRRSQPKQIWSEMAHADQVIYGSRLLTSIYDLTRIMLVTGLRYLC